MIHDVIPLRYPDVIFRNRIHEWYYKATLRSSIWKSDRILTNSEHSKQEIHSVFGVEDHKVRRVTLGVETSTTCYQARTGVLNKYGIHEPYIVALGSTEPRKNNESVIKAFNALLPTSPHLLLVIVGKHWRGRQFDEQLLNPRIVQTGFVVDKDMPYIWSGAKMLVFPSFHEGFGFPVLEAMAHGLPVIASNRTALPEVGGDAVLYVQPDNICEIKNAMLDLLSNSELQADLASRGRERAKLFSWTQMCKDVIALYPELKRN
jgi:glycosyltransferase involved in cell wall biosynthesis